GEELVDRVDLDPHPKSPLFDGAFETSPDPADRGDGSRHDQSEHRRRGSMQGNADRTPQHCAEEESAQLADPERRHPFLVAGPGVVASLPKTHGEAVLTRRVETPADGGGEPPDHRPEDAGNRG